MPVKARLETEITGDDKPFVAAVERAEKRAQTFSGRVEKLFKRSSGVRAERALGGFTENILAGNVPGAVSAIGSRLGLGLATGVGIAAGVAATEAFSKIEERMTRMREIRDKLLTPPQGGLFAPSSEFEGSITQIHEAIAEIDKYQKQRDPFTHGLQNVADFISGQDTGKENAGAVEALRHRASQDIDAMADKQRLLNSAQAEELGGSERNAAILRLETQHRERLYALSKAEASVGVSNPAARNAENRSNELLVASANKRFLLREREMKLASELFRIEGETLNTETAKTKEIQARINALQEEASSSTTTTERKTEISTQLQGLGNQQRNAQFDQADMSPEAVQRRNQEALKNLRREAFNANMDGGESHREAYGLVVSGIAGDGHVGPRQHRGTDFDALFPRQTSQGQDLVSDMIAARRNPSDFYGNVAVTGSMAKSGLTDWGMPGNAITNFGNGPFTRGTIDRPYGAAFTETFNNGAGKQGGGDVASKPDSVSSIVKAIEQAIKGVMDHYWGG